MRRILRPLLAGEGDPHRRQEGERQHRQGDVPVPAMPAAHLVAVQPDLLLGRFEALLDRPAPIRASASRLVAAGPNTTWYAISSGLESLRRTSSQWSHGACCRRHSRNRAQSYRRSPFDPAPALRRRQPSRGSAVARSLAGTGPLASAHSGSVALTASTWGRSCCSSQRRSRRSLP